MNTSGRVQRIVGWVLHSLTAASMIFAGSLKLLGMFPPEEVAKLGLTGWITVIGAGEVATAILLLVPRTSSLGVLLASSFWGGAIGLHISKGDSFVPPSALLLLTWVGAYLRNPATFSSFFAAPAKSQPEPAHSEALAS